VWKNKKQFFHTSLQNAAAFRTVPTGSAAVNQQNNKTGQIICYKNRTFSFATDKGRFPKKHSAILHASLEFVV